MALRAPFPISPITNVWKAVIRYLRSQPQAAPFKTWFVWDGDPRRDMREIDWGDLPAIRISPGDAQGVWIDEISHQLTFLVRIEIAVASTDVTQLYDAWHAIHTSMFTGNTLLGQLEQYQVIQKTSTAAAVRPTAFGGNTGLMASGTLTIKMRLDS